MSRALRYLPGGQMSSIEGYQARQDRVSKNVGMMLGFFLAIGRRGSGRPNSRKTDAVLRTKIVRR